MKYRPDIADEDLASVLRRIAGVDSELIAAVVYSYCGVPAVSAPFSAEVDFELTEELEDRAQSLLCAISPEDHRFLMDAITPVPMPFRAPGEPSSVGWRQPNLEDVADLLRMPTSQKVDAPISRFQYRTDGAVPAAR